MRKDPPAARHSRARVGTLQEGRRARRTALLAAGLAAAGVLTGCGQDTGIQEAAATGSAAAPTPPSGTDLAAGLLPASAFEPGARLLPLTEELLGAGDLPMGGLPPGVELELGGCAPLLAQVQAAAGEGVDDVAAQAALEGSRATVQALVAGPAVEDAVGLVAEALEECREASVTVPEQGAATVTVGAVEEPDLGDAAVQVALTVAATTPDGRQVTVPALVGLVRDGDRLLALGVTDLHGGALGEQAFSDLLEQAYTTQAEALG
jgi:hypothetical protein